MRCVTNVDVVRRVCIDDLDSLHCATDMLLCSENVLLEGRDEARLDALAVACCDRCVAAHFDCVWRMTSREDEIPPGNRRLVWLECDGVVPGDAVILCTRNFAHVQGNSILLDDDSKGSWLVDPTHAVLARFSTKVAVAGPDSSLVGTILSLSLGSSTEKGFASAAIFADDDGSLYYRLCVSPADLTGARDFALEPRSHRIQDSIVHTELDFWGYRVDTSCRVVERQFRRIAALHLDRTIAANVAIHRSAIPDDQRYVILKYLRDVPPF